MAALRIENPQPLIAKRSERQHLTAADYNDNIALWREIVEKQTGEPFQLTGAILYVGEELGELERSLHFGDVVEAADAIGDIYVACWTVRYIIRRDFSFVDTSAELQWYPISDRSHVIASVTGRICEIARKGLKPDEAQEAYDDLRRISIYARRIGDDYDLDFRDDCIEPVLDILDGRLVEGYKMRNGSTIKKADQQPAVMPA